MIIGLPNETYNTFAEGVSKVIETGQHNKIQFINLTVLENTEMSEPEYIKKYGLILRESKLVSHHAMIPKNENEIDESQNLVVATNTMPGGDWLKTKVFCWMISLLYFNKLLQIPLLLAHRIYSLSFRELNEIFMARKRGEGKISQILDFFWYKAKDIQNGGFEHVASKEWLNIWWPVDEYMLIDLCVSGELPEFYEEAEVIISDYLKRKAIYGSRSILADAIRLNKSLIKLPFMRSDLEVSCGYNILEVYEGGLNGENIKLVSGDFHYVINRTSQGWDTWEEWLTHVVWYGSKKSAYIYDYLNKDIQPKDKTGV
jgi:hypothetical protein